MGGRLENKIALVTGGGAGLGKGIVTKFVTEGARVFIWDINGDAASSTSQSFESGKTAAFQGDVSQAADWEKALKQCLENFGDLDIVVNNAGVVYTAQESITVPEEIVDRMIRINYKPIYHSAKAVIPYFREKGKSGVFVNISSMSSPRTRPKLVWYGASKGAVTSATRGLAAEYAKDKIRYNAINPVTADTSMLSAISGGEETQEHRDNRIKMIPLGRIAQPEDIANAACYLASDEASLLTGVCLDVDGGRSLL